MSTPADNPATPEGTFAESLPGPDVQEPRIGGYDPTHDRERARERVAFVLVGLLAVLTVGPIVLIGAHLAEWEQLRDAVTTAIGAVAGLVGAAVTFYYAGDRRR